MKKIGIKLADGTFFPILEDGSPEKKEINLTTVKDNQTKVKVDLYRGEKSSIDEAEYLDTLEISKMKKHPNGEPNIGLAISLDEKNELSAKIVDKESGAQSQVSISLLSEIKNGKKSGDAENSDEAEGVTLASSPAQENVSEKNESAPTETTEENFVDDLPSLDEMDFSLPEISEQDGAPTEAALQNNDFSLDETVSAEPPITNDEPQSSPIDENVSKKNESALKEEVAPDVDVPAQETVQEITAEENESAPTETAEGNFADALPSLDEMDFSLPEISEQDGAPTEAALQDNDFSLDENLSDEPLGNEPPITNDEPQSSPIDENVSEEVASDVDVPTQETIQDSALPDVDVPAEETVQEIPAEEAESAPVETAQDNFADDLLSLDEMDFSLPETSEQDSGAPTETAEDNFADALPSLDEMDFSLPEISEQDGAPTEAALQDDDFSLDETVSAEPPSDEPLGNEPPQSNDEPQLSPIDENISEEAAPDMDVPAQENVSEKNESAPTETAEGNFADALPSLDEMDFSLPEISEQDGAPTEAALQNNDFSLDETVSNEPPNDEPPQSNDEPQPSPIDENVSEKNESALKEEVAPDVDVPAQETVQDSALPDLDFPDISFDESDFSGAKNEIQNESDSASDDLDFSDMDFELPDFSSDGTSSNSDGEKKSSAHNSFDSVSEHNASSADALDFSDLYDDENDYGEESQEKNQRFPLLVCIVCAIICVLALLGILFVAPMRFNSFSENQSQDSAQELPNDFPSERISSGLPPPPERPVEPIAPPAKEDEIVVITETKNVVPDFPPPQEKKSEPKEIIYKIKWGDTLWDLSAAYYKNPWLYPKIARYNNIKNPDYIIAGSTIRIPEE